MPKDLFSPFVGHGMGIRYSSLNSVGDILPNQPMGQGKVRIFNNLLTGNLVVFDSVQRFIEPNGWVSLGYVYNSQKTPQWQLSIPSLINLPVSPTAGNITLNETDGGETVYTWDSITDRYLGPVTNGEVRCELSFDNDQHAWSHYDPGTGSKTVFSSTGQCISFENSAGLETQYHYSSSQLTKIKGPSGQEYLLTYDSNTVRLFVKDVNKNTTLRQTWVFDETGHLQSSTVADIDYTVNYDYPTLGILQTITQTDGTSMGFTYDLSQSDVPLNAISSGTMGNVMKFGREGNTISLTRSGRGDISITLNDQELIGSLSRQNGLQDNEHAYLATEDFQYTPAGQLLTQKQLSNGSTVNTEYNLRGQIQQVRKSPINQKLFNTYNDGGYLTTITREIDGQLISAYHVYDITQNLTGGEAVVLRFSISFTGEVTEYRYFENGDPSGKPTSIRRYTADVMSVDALPSTKDCTAWVNDTDQQAITLTTILHDDNGMSKLIQTYSETDENGHGVNTDDMGSLSTTWDLMGNPLTHAQMNTPTTNTLTIETFDYLSRQLSQNIAEGHPESQLTVQQYDDATATITQTLPSGEIKITQLDSFGHPISKTSQAQNSVGITEQRLTTLERNALGDVSKIIHPDGTFQFNFYDLQGRLCYEVNCLGEVTKHLFNAKYHFTTTTQYALKIDLSALQPVPTIKPSLAMLLLILKSSDDDRTHYTFEPQNTPRSYLIDSAGYLTEKQQDQWGREIAHIQYAAPITMDELTALQQGHLLTRTPDLSVDRVTNNYWNNDGKKIGSIDPAGYVTQLNRNAVGSIEEVVQFANPSTATSRSRDFNDMLPPISEMQDVHTYTFYNAKQKPVMRINAEGFITTFEYYANDLLKQSRVYMNKVDPSWFHNTSIPPALPDTTPEDYITNLDYDHLHRSIRKTDSKGFVDIRTYNERNQIIMQRTGSIDILQDPDLTFNPDTARTIEHLYDQWGQAYAFANAFVANELAEIEVSITDPIERQAAIENVWDKDSTRRTFDHSGLLTKTVSTEKDKTTLHYYDSNRREVLTILPTGAVIECTRNAFGEVVQKHHYLTELTETERKKLKGGMITQALKDLLTPTDDDPIETFEYDLRGLLQKSTDPEGYYTQYGYNAFKEGDSKIQLVDHSGRSISTSYQHNARGQVIKTTREAESLKIVTSAEFHNPLGKQTASTDGEGNTTQIIIDRVGNVTTKIDPNDNQVFVKTFDALKRVITSKNAQGNVTQYQYSQSENTLTIIPPLENTVIVIHLNAFEEKINSTNALGHTEEWTHAPNGKISTHTLANKAMEAFEYDSDGLLTLIEDFTGVLSDYQYNLANVLKQHIQDLEGLSIKHEFTPDALGRITKTIDPKKVINKQFYDKRGLMVMKILDYGTTSKPGLRRQTQASFDGLHTKTSHTEGDEQTPEQYTIAYEPDALSRQVKKVVDPITPEKPSGLNLEQVNTLDKNARVRSHRDANGNLSWVFYDKNGNQRFSVSASGAVLETQYNPINKPSYRIKYHDFLDVSDINSETTLEDFEDMLDAIRNPEQDSVTYHYYNDNEYQSFLLMVNYDPKSASYHGILQHREYDLANQEISRTGYANTLPISDPNTVQYTNAELEQLAAGLASNQDKTTYYTRDENGRIAFYFDPFGAVKSLQRNAKGQIIAKTEYAHLVANPEELSKLKPSEISIPDNPRTPNRVTYRVFHPVYKKPMYLIKPTGAVIQYVHDRSGHLTEIIEFADTILPKTDYNERLAQLESLTPSRANGDRIIKHTISAVGQIETIQDALGQKTEYDHNALGSIKSITNRNGDQTRYIYDPAKRLTDTISPESDVTTVQLNGEGLTPTTVNRSVVKHNRYDNNNNVTDIINDYNYFNNSAYNLDTRSISLSYTPDNQKAGSIIRSVFIDDPTKNADSFESLPTQMVDITTEKQYNGFGKVAVEKDKNGGFSYYVYNNQALKIFSVKPDGSVTYHQRDTFGKELALLQYDNKLPLSIVTAGKPLTADMVLSNLTPNPDKDQTTTFERDLRGGIRVYSLDDVMHFMPGKSVPTQCKPSTQYQTDALNPDKDQTTTFERDLRGGIRVDSLDDVMHFMPGESVPTLGKPSIQYQTDAFKNKIAIRKARFSQAPELDNITYKWFDAENKVIAVAETVQPSLPSGSYVLKDAPILYRIKVMGYDAFGNMVKRYRYATPIKSTNIGDLSVDAMLALCTTSSEDRQTVSTFDANNQELTRTKVQVTRQQIELAEGPIPVPSMTDITVNLTETSSYYPEGQLKTKKKPNGSTITEFINERGKQTSSIGVPIDTATTDGVPTTFHPLTEQLINPHGQMVGRTNYVNGAKSATDPTPSAPDAVLDKSVYHQFDNRGLSQRTQQPNVNIDPPMPVIEASTSTRAGKLARKFTQVTNIIDLIEALYDEHVKTREASGETFGSADEESAYRTAFIENNTVYWDECRTTYNISNQAILQAYYRNGQIQTNYTTQQSIDTFGNAIGTGPGNNQFPLYRVFDQTRGEWNSNYAGIPTVVLKDLNGNTTVTLQNAAIDLSTVTDQHDLPTLFDHPDSELTISYPDTAGRELAKQFPAFMGTDPNSYPLMQIPIWVANSIIPNQGQHQILWSEIPESSFVYKIVLWQRSDTQHERPIEYAVVTDETAKLYGIVADDLVSDIYDYEITYTAHDVNMYATKGTLQINTGLTTSLGFTSTELVAETFPQTSGTTVYLSGNTTGLTAVQLLKAGEVLNTFTPVIAPEGEGLILDLSQAVDKNNEPLLSGTYSLHGIRGSATDAFESLAFSLYTEHNAANTPTTRVIEYQMQIQVLDLHAQLSIWDELPAEYSDLSVLFTCEYTDTAGGTKSYSTVIAPDTNLGTFTGSDGKTITANIKFPDDFQSINYVDCDLQSSDLNLPLYIAAVPLIGEGPLSFTYQTDHAKRDKFFVMRQQISTNNEPNSATPVRSLQFSQRSLAYVQNLQTININDLPTASYLDIAQGVYVKPIQIISSAASESAMVFDVTGVAPGQYPLTIQSTSLTQSTDLIITEGFQVYNSQSPCNASKIPITDFVRYKRDNFDNPIETANPSGITLQDYSDENKPIAIHYPPVMCTDETGHSAMLATAKYMGYDLLGHSIGTTDENGHTSASVRNGSGLVVNEILGDGTISQTNYFDGLARHWAHRDSLNNLWTNQLDASDNIAYTHTAYRSFMYLYDVRSSQIVTGAPANSGGYSNTYYAHDVRKNISHILAPGTSLISQSVDRNGKLLVQSTANLGTMSWSRTFFGLPTLQVLMDGTEVRFGYDAKNQLANQTSSGGTPHQTINLEYVTQNVSLGPFDIARYSYWAPVTSFVPDQNLVFHYNAGLLQSVQDLAQNRLSTFGYDTQRRRVARSEQFGVSLQRLMTMSYDAKNRPVRIYDTQVSVENWFDNATNYRRRQAVGLTPVPVDDWYLMDAANRVLIDKGILVNGHIVPNGASSIAVSYTDPNRHVPTNCRFVEVNQGVTNSIQYDLESRVTSTIGNNGTSTARQYDVIGDIAHYTEMSSGKNVHTDYLFDTNGTALGQNTDLNNQPNLENQYHYISTGLNISSVNTVSHDDGKQTTIDENYAYLLKSSQLLEYVTGTTTNENGQRSSIPAARFYDANLNVSGQQNNDDPSQDPNNYNPTSTVFSTTFDGLLLQKQTISTSRGFFSLDVSTTYVNEKMFFDPNGKVFASYMIPHDPRQSQFNSGISHYSSRFGGGRGSMNGIINAIMHAENSFIHALSGINGPYSSGPTENDLSPQFVLQDDFEPIVAYPRPYSFMDYVAFHHGKNTAKAYNNYVPQNMSNYPPLAPNWYATPRPMSMSEVSTAATGTPNFAEQIAQANGISSVNYESVTGERFRIPALQLNIYNDKTNPDYAALMNQLIGSLSPHLNFAKPHHHHSCLTTVITIVISVIAIVVAPYLAPAIFDFTVTAGAITIGAAIAIGVTAALVDAALQGLAIGVGLLHSFSWQEVLEAALSAGLPAGLGLDSIKIANIKSLSALLHVIALEGALNLTTQLAEIAVGERKSLNLRELLMTLVTSALSIGEQIDIPLPKSAFERFLVTETESLLNSVVGDAIMGAPIDIEQWAEQQLGNMIGDAIGEAVISNLLSGEPTQHARASRPKSSKNAMQHYQAGAAAAHGAENEHDYLPTPPTGGFQKAGNASQHQTVQSRDHSNLQYTAAVTSNSTGTPSQSHITSIANLWAEKARAANAQSGSSSSSEYLNSLAHGFKDKALEELSSPLAQAELGHHVADQFLTYTKFEQYYNTKLQFASLNKKIIANQIFNNLEHSSSLEFTIARHDRLVSALADVEQSEYVAKTNLSVVRALDYTGKGLMGLNFISGAGEIVTATPQNRMRTAFEVYGSTITAAAFQSLVAGEAASGVGIVFIPLTELLAAALGSAAGKEAGDLAYDATTEVHGYYERNHQRISSNLNRVVESDPLLNADEILRELPTYPPL